MADIIYTVNQEIPENIEGFEQYSQEDRELISSFQINSVFDPTKNSAQLHILSLSDELLESIYDYSRFSQLGNAQSAGQTGASVLTIDPIADSKAYGYENGGVKLLYHFLDDLYTPDRSTVDFYIQEISQDRTEVSLSTLSLTAEELTSITSTIKSRLQSQSYFTGFRLDFKNNDLFIATNIDTLTLGDEKVVVVKLYEPLPIAYREKSTLSVVEVISDSVAYEVDSEFIIEPDPVPTLRSPNFNIDIADESVVPTGYYNYDELLSYPINNSNSEIYTAISERGVDISIDFSNFSNFIHFSSAQERLLNFKYKLDLIASYSQSIASGSNATTGLQGISGSRLFYEKQLTGVISNFDQYERFLYYESGSDSWPKTGTTKPYTNKISTNAEAINWYTSQISDAINYDNTNYNSLIQSIPAYLRDDASNQNYLTFVFMVGQHFDNLWLYSKAVTDKYDADNRIGFGISKDLVAEALKNFGVKLYTSNNSIQDLFTTIIGQAYQTGSEVITNYITGSLTGSGTPIQPSSYNNYEKEIQKRIYHNLPLLIKSKGTERGLRALINCFGIPSEILKIKTYGGRNTEELPYYGDSTYYTSSLDKIRLDHTGSIIAGNTLSTNTSIIKRDVKYTDDLHSIEVGFSPTDNIDNFIVSASLATGSLSNFNIDEYIGDPRNLYMDRYEGLDLQAQNILGDLTQYNLQDYVRLIKFFDNIIFKMIKDFIPARAVADTGIIIKPNLLNRSKAKSVQVEVTQPEYSGSLDTAFISGSNARSFGAKDDYITSYTTRVQTPWGLGDVTNNQQEQPKFNGELYNSGILISNGEWNEDNIYKYNVGENYTYNIQLFDTLNICIFNTSSIALVNITSSTALYNANIFFPVGTSPVLTTYTSSNPAGAITHPTMPISFPGYGQYQYFQITASNGIYEGETAECIDVVDVMYGICSINLTGSATGPIVIQPGYNASIGDWFDIDPSQTVNFTVVQYPSELTTTYPDIVTPFSSSHLFEDVIGTAIITVTDSNFIQEGFCSTSKTISISACNIVPYIAVSPYVAYPPILFNPASFAYLLSSLPIGGANNTADPDYWQGNFKQGLHKFFLNTTPGTTRFLISDTIFPSTYYYEGLGLDTSPSTIAPVGGFPVLPADYPYTMIRIVAYNPGTNGNSPTCYKSVTLYEASWWSVNSSTVVPGDGYSGNGGQVDPDDLNNMTCYDSSGNTIPCIQNP